MLTHLDHLVILVQHLGQAVADYEQLGFAVTSGGTHADGLTHNALVVFRDGTYLELIAFVDPNDSRDNVWNWRQFAAKGGGLIDWCVASDDLARDVADFRTQNLSVSDPTDGGRTRPDGVQLRWRSAHFWQTGRELPFVIEDRTARAWRVPTQQTEHRNGAVGIGELTLAVADLARTATTFAAIFNTKAAPIIRDARLDAQVTTLHVGEQTLVLAEAAGQHSPIHSHLETTGPGPYEITLLRDEPRQPTLLDRRRTGGVSVRIV